MKTYPISIAKHDHDLHLLHDVAFNNDQMDLVQEINEIRTAMHSSSRDGRVGYLPGKMYGRAKELIASAQDLRTQKNAGSRPESRRQARPTYYKSGESWRKDRRKYVPFSDAAKASGFSEWWEVEYENMGWCADGCTRWYHFDAEDGTPCYTLKYGERPKYN